MCPVYTLWERIEVRVIIFLGFDPLAAQVTSLIEIKMIITEIAAGGAGGFNPVMGAMSHDRYLQASHWDAPTRASAHVGCDPLGHPGNSGNHKCF